MLNMKPGWRSIICDVPDDENESCWDITEREHGPCPEADEITSYYVSSCEYILDTYMTPIWNAQRADRIAKYEAGEPKHMTIIVNLFGGPGSGKSTTACQRSLRP